jgi:hypothetical protein
LWELKSTHPVFDGYDILEKNVLSWDICPKDPRYRGALSSKNLGIEAEGEGNSSKKDEGSLGHEVSTDFS